MYVVCGSISMTEVAVSFRILNDEWKNLRCAYSKHVSHSTVPLSITVMGMLVKAVRNVDIEVIYL